jgi:hypothetical protein
MQQIFLKFSCILWHISFSFNIFRQLSVSLSVLSKVYHKILVSLEMVQNFKISDLAMPKFEKVNVTFT